jgi:hypothetical protein
LSIIYYPPERTVKLISSKPKWLHLNEKKLAQKGRCQRPMLETIIISFKFLGVVRKISDSQIEGASVWSVYRQMLEQKDKLQAFCSGYLPYEKRHFSYRQLGKGTL